MKLGIGNRGVRAGGWMAVGGAAAVVTGSTPIGIAIVAAVAGALAWRSSSLRAQ